MVALHDSAVVADAAEDAPVEPDAAARASGPFEVPFLAGRSVYYAIPPRPGKHRLLAMLHGVCNPPGYACGHIWPAAVERGFLVCPTGNGRCAWNCTDCRADRKDGPPSWEESFDDADRDLERAVAKVDALHPGEIDREGAVLMGFSRGAWIALHAARRHPGRWPYLVLIEADVQVAAASLRAAGVRAVALMPGGWGLNVKGMGDNVAQLVRDGMRARLFTMPKAGHHYSEGIDELLREVLRWLLGEDAGVSGFP